MADINETDKNGEKLSDDELESVTGGVTAAGGKYDVYTVESGDCLSVIADRYGVSCAQLARLNNIENPDLIYPDQQLLIPRRKRNGFLSFFVNLFMRPFSRR